MSTEKSDNYFRGVCRRPECAAYTRAGNVASYWHGPHRSDRAKAAADYDRHVAGKHAITPTAGRRRALLTLLAADESASTFAGQMLRVSNETNAANVYWQSAQWLAVHGLAKITNSPAGEVISLTPAGIELARRSA